MKILMISTFPFGGATIAARRQVEALLHSGFDCSLVCIAENTQTDEIHVTRDGYQILINVPTSDWNSTGRLSTAYCMNNRSNVSNTWFSLWLSETTFDDHLLQVCSEFDVIHFHWISQMVSSRFIDQLVSQNKRIAVTSHDVNHFTGGCHYSAGCRDFEKGCHHCPQLLSDPLKLVEKSYEQKMAAMSQLNAVWLFPSQWLLNEFASSKSGKSVTPVKLLRNCLDLKSFTCLSEKTRATKRLEFGFSEKDLVFIAGAADNSEKRKGFEYLESGLRRLSEQLNRSTQNEPRLVIVTFGYGEPTLNIGSSRIRHQHLGALDESQMISLFQSSDLLVFPSIEENFSNIVLESLMCGCPVMGFEIGGVPDIVVPGINGYLVSSIDHDQFGDAFVELADSERLTKLRKTTQEWRDANAAYYGYDHISAELMEAYQQVLPTSKAEQDMRSEPVSSDADSLPSRRSATRDEANMQKMHSERENNYVKNSKRNDKNRYSNQLKLDAVFNGFSEPANLDGIGRAMWLLVDNSILFRVNASNRPALCFQIANVDRVVKLFDQALPALRASINSREATIQISAHKDNSKFIYLWIIPDAESLFQDEVNCLKLGFESPSVPYERDSRGFLFSQVTLFDLNCLDDEVSVSLVPDYVTSNTLNLKVSQTEFIRDDWDKNSDEKPYLPNVISMWSEVLSDFNEPSENNK